MKYTVFFPNGRIMCFYVRSVAELYASNSGGVLIGEEILREDLKPSTLQGY